MNDINWLGVLLGVVAGQVIGFLWYGVVFKKAWLAVSGVTPDSSKSANLAMAAGIVPTLVTVLGLAFLIGHFEAADWMGGAHAGLFSSVFFAATTVALRAIYSNDTFSRRSWTLFAIDAGYLVVYMTVAGAILGGMGG